MTDRPGADRRLWPQTWHLDNYARGVPQGAAAAYLAQHAVYAVLATAVMLLSSVPAAYALARLRWRGRNLAFLRDHRHDDAAAAGHRSSRCT